MGINAPLKSEFSYFRRLIEAGLNAATSVRSDASGESAGQQLALAARSAWKPAAIGSAVGALTMLLARRGKNPANALFGAIVGGAVGFGSGVAWSSREVTSEMAREAVKKVGSLRDAHWLEKHPITYG